MTTQATAVTAGQVSTAPPETRHRHDSTCYWDIDDCRWQCTIYPAVRYALERCTEIARPIADTGKVARP